MLDRVELDFTSLTAQVLGAYVANNPTEVDDLPELIRTVHAAFHAIHSPASLGEASPVHAPAVSVRRSLASREHILSLIDGRPYKMLKRHLAHNGLTPDAYRERYRLPPSYPMVAPAYSEQRRQLAEAVQLSRRQRTAAPAATASENHATLDDASHSEVPDGHNMPGIDPSAPLGEGKRGSPPFRAPDIAHQPAVLPSGAVAPEPRRRLRLKLAGA